MISRFWLNDVTNGSFILNPDAKGGITVEVKRILGAYAYINFMKVEITKMDEQNNLSLKNGGFETGNLDKWTMNVANSASTVELIGTTVAGGNYAVLM